MKLISHTLSSLHTLFIQLACSMLTQLKNLMDIVDKISVPVVIHIAVLELLGTIFLCYGIAVWLGHVPVWLPMISDCAVDSPEKYPFRLGMIMGACLLQVEVLLAYHSNKGYSRSKFCLVTGSLASIGLGVVGAVNEEENNTVHSSKI